VKNIKKLFAVHSGVSRGISKIVLKQKTYNLFSLWHPQGYP